MQALTTRGPLGVPTVRRLSLTWHLGTSCCRRSGMERLGPPGNRAHGHGGGEAHPELNYPEGRGEAGELAGNLVTDVSSFLFLASLYTARAFCRP